MNIALHFDQLFALDGKVALVTGGASGIGKRVSQVLADAGAVVVVADMDLEGASKVASAIGERAFAIGFDLRDSASIQALFEALRSREQKLDILINNAGVYPRHSFEDVTRGQWEEMQRVNVWGCFEVLRAAAKLMAESDGGRIVNVSSIGAARTAVNDQVAYNASKAALDSITQSAALEYAGNGILVNSILPGAVQPLDPKPPGAGSKPTGPLLSDGRIVLGRYATPDEVAGPILMLVSPAGGYISGQTLIVDGGFSLS